MTTQFDGRSFTTNTEPTYKQAFTGTRNVRPRMTSSLIARRNIRRERRENRAI